MAVRSNENSWVDAVISMDRSQRIFGEFVKPILARHAADLSFTNLVVLLSIGTGDALINDIVSKGRYVGSNASYSFKTLAEQGLIERRQDPNDRRSGIVSYTKKGADLVRDIRHASRAQTRANKEICDLLVQFENHCVRLPSSV